MDFKGPYLQAMREQAPTMFNRLVKTGALDQFVQKRSEEAHALYDQLTKDAAKLPNGVVSDPQIDRTAQEQVLATMLEFPEQGAPEAA